MSHKKLPLHLIIVKKIVGLLELHSKLVKTLLNVNSNKITSLNQYQ